MTELNKRLTEIDVILSFLPDEDLVRIPEELKRVIKENKDTSYDWQFNTEISLKEQNINKDTISFLAYIYIKYLLNDEEKEYMRQILEYNEKKTKVENENIASQENGVKEESSVDDIENVAKNVEIAFENCKDIIEYKENVFVKFFKKIKNLFTKK